ncbi:MAG TPA: bifunctional DNA-formamidopyrimidine glycosylase/DNA-(apurinic or apyrimidinic site) lyase [Jiangellales bacterium]|nr:bifunctional DNA-formamidopyrimidine glycosylase/DNA-(apurinic or apyrimidinic site) lyase [Jiangellales bacterium]
MPELPEVEVVRRGLQRWVVGRTVDRATVLHPRAVRRHLPGASDLSARLAGRTVLAARRRGKYLWLPLDTDEALVAHLGMSGQLLVQPPEAPDETHLRVRVEFTDGGRELRFVDQRTFGGLTLSTLPGSGTPDGGVPGGGVPAVLAHIAADPLDPAFDDASFVRSLRARHTGIKRALLDQTLLSGVGNIYADEGLWRAGLHYARPTETLTRGEALRMLAAVREVMAAALERGGTSFDSLYVNVNGESGYFDRSLAVYGRAGQPCLRCGTPVRRDPFMNRSSYTCPRCQPRPRRARW